MWITSLLIINDHKTRTSHFNIIYNYFLIFTNFDALHFFLLKNRWITGWEFLRGPVEPENRISRGDAKARRNTNSRSKVGSVFHPLHLRTSAWQPLFPLISEFKLNWVLHVSPFEAQDLEGVLDDFRRFVPGRDIAHNWCCPEDKSLRIVAEAPAD